MAGREEECTDREQMELVEQDGMYQTVLWIWEWGCPEATLDYFGHWATKPTKEHAVERTDDERSSGWMERSTASRGKPKKLERWYKSEINWGIPTNTGGIYSG